MEEYSFGQILLAEIIGGLRLFYIGSCFGILVSVVYVLMGGNLSTLEFSIVIPFGFGLVFSVWKRLHQ